MKWNELNWWCDDGESDGMKYVAGEFPKKTCPDSNLLPWTPHRMSETWTWDPVLEGEHSKLLGHGATIMEEIYNKL